MNFEWGECAQRAFPRERGLPSPQALEEADAPREALPHPLRLCGRRIPGDRGQQRASRLRQFLRKVNKVSKVSTRKRGTANHGSHGWGWWSFDQAHGIPTGFRPPARGCGGTPLPRESNPTPPAQPQRGCVPQGVIAGIGCRQDGASPGRNPLGVGGIGGVTRPKVAPRTSGQPWAPGRNRVAVGRSARGAAGKQKLNGRT